MLFGGQDNNLLSDTWTWEGTTWVQQAPPSSPTSRSQTATAYDPATASLVLFGGPKSSGVLQNDTWIYAAPVVFSLYAACRQEPAPCRRRGRLPSAGWVGA